MTIRRAVAGVLLAGTLAAGCEGPGTTPESGRATAEAGGVAHADTVRIPLPSGDPGTDRAALVEALTGAAPGSLVQFQAGTYVVGALLRIDTPGLVLEGHPEGTVLRGCSLDDYAGMERDAAQAWEEDPSASGYGPLARCGMFHFTGGEVTLRGLVFEQSRLGVILGCCEADGQIEAGPGGYLVEGNTFRNTGNSVRAALVALEPTIVRDNTFTNTFHALSAVGSRIHFVNNRVSVPDSEQVPGEGYAGFAVAIGAVSPDYAAGPTPAGACSDNHIVGNSIEGHVDGIVLRADPGTVCSGTRVAGNTVRIRRARYPQPWPYEDIFPLPNPDDPTLAGVPLTVLGFGGDGVEPGRFEATVVEENRVEGADGLGLEIVNAPGIRIEGNRFSEIRMRAPFPGNPSGAMPGWEAANGAAIWLGPGSDGAEVGANHFADVARWEIYLDAPGVRLPAPAEGVRIGRRAESGGG
jgi:hypothetical protein